MINKIFNPEKLNKLNNPERLKILPIEKISEQFSCHPPEVIIDYGAGTGLFSKELSKIYKYAKIYALDIERIMIGWIKDNVVKDYPNINPIIIDGNFNFDDGVADLIIMINLFHELDNHKKVLDNCYKMLKIGGIIVISDWKKGIKELGPRV